MEITVRSYSSNAYTPAQSSSPAPSDPGNAASSTTTTGTDSSSSVTVSWFSQQLSAAASRAQTRDTTLSRAALGETAKTSVDKIAGDTFWANRAAGDAEVPKSADPQAVSLAKQATAFVNGSGSNPFKGMSREQLDLIAYDDSGTFTVNERHAAWQEAYDQEEAWRVQVIAEGEMEYQTTGKQNNFFEAVLKHYQGLPAIEQAQYPADYTAQLQHWISLDFNFRTNRAEGSGDSHNSVMTSLLSEGPYGAKATGTAVASAVDQGSKVT